MITLRRSQEDIIAYRVIEARRMNVLYLTRLIVLGTTPAGTKVSWIRHLWMSNN